MYGYEIFHERLMRPLIESVHKDHSANTYIFEGEAGLGRHQAALLFANALVCERTASAPCGGCSACVQAKSETHPDIIHVNSGAKKTIGVDKIRQICEDAQVKPFYGGKKVYIIDDASTLTEGAQNAMLKTIEEPPEYAVFVLIIDDASKLLTTVQSRSVKIQFNRISDDNVKKYIEENFPQEHDRIVFLTKFCGGIPKMADKIIKDESFERLREASFSNLAKLLSSRLLFSYDIVEFVEQEKESAEKIMDFWLMFLRDILCMICDQPDKIINRDFFPKIREAAANVDAYTVSAAIEEIVLSRQMLERYVNLRANILALCIRIKRRAEQYIQS